jgi:hypothetical protein
VRDLLYEFKLFSLIQNILVKPFRRYNYEEGLHLYISRGVFAPCHIPWQTVPVRVFTDHSLFRVNCYFHYFYFNHYRARVNPSANPNPNLYQTLTLTLRYYFEKIEKKYFLRYYWLKMSLLTRNYVSVNTVPGLRLDLWHAYIIPFN